MPRAARAALILIALLPGAVAQAAETPVFALKPVGHAELGYYRFSASPGETIRARVRIVNAGKVAGSAELAVVDAVTGATTGAVYETVGARSEDVGAWLRLETGEVALEPGASRVVGFTVTVPSDARRGQHLGGVVARPTVPDAEGADGEAKHSFRVNIVDQSILAVQVDLPGEARGLLKVRGVEAGGNPGYQTLRITLSHPGEKMVKGRATVVVKGAGGRVVNRQSFAIDTFLPRTRIDYPMPLRGKALVPGEYEAEVTLRWDGGQSSTTSHSFAVTEKNIEQAFGSEGLAQLPGTRDAGGTPVMLLAGGGLLVMLLGFAGVALYFRRRTRELERRFGGPPEDGAGEIRLSDARTPAGPASQAEEPAGRI